MSFDIPIHLADNSPEARVIEAIVKRDRVSPEEVVRRAIRTLNMPQAAKEPTTRNRKTEKPDVLTDELINELKSLDSSYGLLEDVPDENIRRMSETIRRMKREGFPSRA